MKIPPLQIPFAVSLLLVGIAGCARGPSVALHPSGASRLSETRPQQAFSQPVSPSHFAENPGTTVRPSLPDNSVPSAADEAGPVGPSLVTLPAGADLEEQLSQVSGAVVLDFFADWCGPCRRQSEILHEIETDVAKSGGVIIKINVDEHPRIARDFQVSSLPTLMMVNDGEVTRRKTGVTTRDQLLAWID